MMGLERRGPARVVGRQVDEEQPFARMHRVDQLAELVERRRELVELRHRRIDRKEVRRREWASILAHDSVGRRHGKRRQGLDDPEAHVAHDEVQAPGDLAKRTELTGKDRVDRIVRPRLGALDLDVQIASLGPLGHVRAFGEETRFAGKDADLVKRDLRRVDAGRRLRQRNVRPRARQGRLPPFRLRDDLTPADFRVSEIRAEGGVALARRIQRQRHGQRVTTPFEDEVVG